MGKLSRLFVGAALVLGLLAGCTKQETVSSESAEPEEETLARTEFTLRVENFFEYAVLKSKKSSFFRIHLTDLSDGAPVAQGQVTLAARRPGSTQPVAEATARVGKVTGIYVADLTLPEVGDYEIVFHIKNDKLDETMALSGFKVE